MIISTSYKTDIPTFYSSWFMNRLEAGYCKIVNPYNRKAYKISLKRKDVDGFVFWTKNLGPFMNKLEIIHEKNYPFMIQYTINKYPAELEYSVVQSDKSIAHMKTLKKLFGPKVAVWRYDTILFTSLTPYNFHIKNFKKLSQKLEGTTNEVIISFAQFYRKTLRNIKKAAKECNFSWEDPPKNIKTKLIIELYNIAKEHNMDLKICSQPELIINNIKPASCIDVHRLSDIAGYVIDAERKPRRSGCGCYRSIDIGEYNTCPHGCVYCYAVNNHKLARKRFKEHNPKDEYIFKSKKINNKDTIEIQRDKKATFQKKLL